jgi:hypothetical protein
MRLIKVTAETFSELSSLSFISPKPLMLRKQITIAGTRPKIRYADTNFADSFVRIAPNVI